MSLLLESLVPGFLVLGLGWVVLPWLSADSQRARTAMVAVMIVLMWRYLLCRQSASAWILQLA
jgi:hypothetical protein